MDSPARAVAPAHGLQLIELVPYDGRLRPALFTLAGGAKACRSSKAPSRRRGTYMLHIRDNVARQNLYR